jgi:uncharacterized protein (DUF1778 family)
MANKTERLNCRASVGMLELLDEVQELLKQKHGTSFSQAAAIEVALNQLKEKLKEGD